MYDVARTPALFTDREKGNRLIPAEGAIAAMDVKHMLTRRALHRGCGIIG